jgi:RHS repeat-associated protein
MSRLALRVLFLAALALAALGANAQTLSASPSSVYSGQSVSATWSGIAAPTSSDWIALYVVGAADNAFISWRYTTGTAAGSVPFAIPANAAAGTYELRLFSNNGYARLATSNSFTVQTPPPATLSVSPSSVYLSQSVTASWSAIFAPTSSDWIALYVVGAADNAFISWRYTTGTAAGSVPFAIPANAAAGTYELRLFSNNGYARLATSNSFTVQTPPAATLSASPSSVAPGGTVTASWSAIFAPTATDWIGLYLPSAADNAFISWRFTDGTAAGSVPFAIPANAAGTYQLRLFSNNGYTRLATSANFSVGSATLSFIHVDHLNTPRLVANQQGQTVWRWDQQEPFGVTVPDENPSGLGSFEFTLRFPGQYFDRETNLAYNFWRDYDFSIGRYIQSDIVGLGSGLNTYLYGHADPIAYFDPDGLYPQRENGNRRPGHTQQDMVCTLRGPIGTAANANPCIKKCCIAHDNCYTQYRCNESSWHGRFPTQCMQCNFEAVLCIVNALTKSRRTCGSCDE